MCIYIYIYCGWFVVPLRILQYFFFPIWISDSLLPRDGVNRTYSRTVAETLHSNAFLFVSHGAITGHLYPIVTKHRFGFVCITFVACGDEKSTGGETWEGDSVHSGRTACTCVFTDHVYPGASILIDFTWEQSWWWWWRWWLSALKPTITAVNHYALLCYIPDDG